MVRKLRNLNQIRIVKHKDMGYSVQEYFSDAMFWEQVTPWYKYLGNLKRFHPEYFE